MPDLVRLEAYVEPSNTPSIRSVEAAGFTYEGLLRSYMSLGGNRRDMAVYSRVRGDGG